MAKEYPNFVFFTPKMAYFQNPRGGLGDWNRPSRCPVALYGLAYGANGKPKQPCAMGGGTNCDKVNVPAAMTGLIEQYLKTGIAKIDGFIIFVAGARAGQQARVKVTDVAPRFAKAEIAGKSSDEE
jgi:hypothetical protein